MAAAHCSGVLPSQANSVLSQRITLSSYRCIPLTVAVSVRRETYWHWRPSTLTVWRDRISVCGTPGTVQPNRTAPISAVDPAGFRRRRMLVPVETGRCGKLPKPEPGIADILSPPSPSAISFGKPGLQVKGSGWSRRPAVTASRWPNTAPRDKAARQTQKKTPAQGGRQVMRQVSYRQETYRAVNMLYAVVNVSAKLKV
jgi:hypothetical protein